MTTGGLHENLDRRHEAGPSSDRGFGFLLGGFLVVIGIWPVVFRGASFPAGLRLWALIPGAVAVLAGVLLPRVLHPLNLALVRLGMLIAKVTNPVALGLLYLLVFTPIGFLMRLAGKDPLRLRFQPDAPSYWIERRPPGPPPDSMMNQF